MEKKEWEEGQKIEEKKVKRKRKKNGEKSKEGREKKRKKKNEDLILSTNIWALVRMLFFC